MPAGPEGGRRELWGPTKAFLAIICHRHAFPRLRADQILCFFGLEHVCSLVSKCHMCSSSHGEIPGGRSHWPDLDLLPRGSSQLWSKARSHGANMAARSQPSSLLSPKQSCPLQIGFLYLYRHMAQEGYSMDPKFCHFPHPRHTRNQPELLNPNA